MKRIIIEGEVGEEIKKQMNQINSLSKAMEDMAVTKYELEKRIWEQAKKEFPDISNNCTISIIDDVVLLLDRLKD